MMIIIDPECQKDPFSDIDITLDWHKMENRNRREMESDVSLYLTSIF